MGGMMFVGRGLKSRGLFTAEITTASTLKIMRTRKAKLHMPTQASTHLCVATMNQFTIECWSQVAQMPLGDSTGVTGAILLGRGRHGSGWAKRVPRASHGPLRAPRGHVRL